MQKKCLIGESLPARSFLLEEEEEEEEEEVRVRKWARLRGERGGKGGREWTEEEEEGFSFPCDLEWLFGFGGWFRARDEGVYWRRREAVVRYGQKTACRPPLHPHAPLLAFFSLARLDMEHVGNENAGHFPPFFGKSKGPPRSL